MSTLTPQVIRSLIFENLATETSKHVEDVAFAVTRAAINKNLLQMDLYNRHAQPTAPDRGVLDVVQQVMWQLLVQGSLTWGADPSQSSSNSYPFFRLTDHGRKSLRIPSPQPYDPNGFIEHFQRNVPNADDVTLEYLTEAVRAFNSNCYKSTAVMLGAASEQAVLLLNDTFEQAIDDPTKRAVFEKESSPRLTISRRYEALKDRLDKMVSAKKFADHRELKETIDNQLPTVFSTIKRCRDDAGHPQIPRETDPDGVFLNLRVFVEYARRVFDLIEHFKKTKADW